MTILSIKVQTSERGIVDIDLVKDCPECEGEGYYIVYTAMAPCQDDCPHCKGSGNVPRYITPEIFEEITGDKVPDDFHVYFFVDGKYIFKGIYSERKLYPSSASRLSIILAFGQPAPDANWRPE